MAVAGVANSSQEVDDLVQLVQANIEEVNKVLDDIQKRYEKQLDVQKKLLHDQNRTISKQEVILNEFQSKLCTLEEQILYPSHMSVLYERMFDDHEQTARKTNLKIYGIEVFDYDTPETILNYIQSECKRLKLRLEPVEFDTAYRIGAKYCENGKLLQVVLLKMRCSVGRNEIYKNRDKFKFQAHPDLTENRQTTLNYAKYAVRNDVAIPVMQQIDSVYADDNCRLTLKTKCGEVFGFSCESEFTALIEWLEKDFFIKSIGDENA